MRHVRSLLPLLLLLALPAGALAAKARVKGKVQVPADTDLVVTIDKELFATCLKWRCWLDVIGGELEREHNGATVNFAPHGKEDATFRFLVAGDGAWAAYGFPKKEDDKDGKGDDDDSAGDDDDSAVDFMQKPILTRQEWADKELDGLILEADERTEIASGQLADKGESFELTIDKAWLPAKSFRVGVNGYWGARIGDVVIGSGKRTGVVEVQR